MPLSRRQFVIASYTASIWQTGIAAGRLPQLDPASAHAKALGYTDDHNKVDARRWPKKGGMDGSAQQCKTCALYRRHSDGSGSCSMFLGEKIQPEGWCNGWLKDY